MDTIIQDLIPYVWGITGAIVGWIVYQIGLLHKINREFSKTLSESYVSRWQFDQVISPLVKSVDTLADRVNALITVMAQDSKKKK